MMIPMRKNFFTPPQFALASAGCLGTSQKFQMERTWPIGEILLHVDFLVGTQLTLSGLDNILGIVKKVDVSINDGVQPRSVVNYSGIGLLERSALLDENLDSATLNAIALSQGATIAAGMRVHLTYRIPLIHPNIEDPIAALMLLPVHLWNQDPILTVDFAALTDMTSAGTITALSTTVQLLRNIMTPGLELEIKKAGGYLPYDIFETGYTVAAGAGQVDQRFVIPTPGSYMELCFRQYAGVATAIRDVLDASHYSAGAVIETDQGAETRWRLESGGVVYSDWRWKHLKTLNDFSRPLNLATQAGSPAIGGIVAANTSYQRAGSTALDFLTTGIGGGNGVTDLGSMLDCNTPDKSGLKMELIGSVHAGFPGASQIWIGGQRLFGDISRFQQIKF